MRCATASSESVPPPVGLTNAPCKTDDHRAHREHFRDRVYLVHRNKCSRFFALSLVAASLVLPYAAASAQVAGYRLGAHIINYRTLPCKDNFGDQLCAPGGGVSVRLRRGKVVEIDSTWVAVYDDYVAASDVWQRMQGALVARFAMPDSVRIMNPLRLPEAYFDGVGAFWTKANWCAVLTIKTGDRNSKTVAFIDLTVEKRGAWASPCSVYPYLAPSP